MKHLLFFCLALSFFKIVAQCPTISMPSSFSLTNCTSGQTVMATSNYSANISSRWIGPFNVTMNSTGTSTSIVSINLAGTYTVEFKDNVSNCIVTNTLNVSSTIKPSFYLQSPGNFSIGCGTQSIIIVNIVNAAASTPGAPVAYSLASGTFLNPSPGTLTPISTYSLSNCGPYFVVVREFPSNCVSSLDFVVNCASLAAQPLPITITPSAQVCAGSSVTLTASGASSYSWSTGSTVNPVIVQTPGNGQILAVTAYGFSLNTCTSSNSLSLVSNTTCAIVWPGDANSDGSVNTMDVLEVGVQFGGTGPSRSNSSNSFTGQYASAWTGTVSTGSNRCHADCNGDGQINFADTSAISTNFSLTHAFRPSPTSSADLSLVNATNSYMPGRWNTVDLVFGDAQNIQSQIQGIAFDISYDGSIVENDSIYLEYTSSFVNANSQNIQFTKHAPTTDRIYAATVRTDANNVTGNGKIGELKFKAAATSTGTLQLAVSNVNRINKYGTKQALSGSNQALSVNYNLVGLHSEHSDLSVVVLPNPSSGIFKVKLNTNEVVDFKVFDLTGELLSRGLIKESTGTIDLDLLPAGVYYLSITNTHNCYLKKLIVIK